MVSKDTDAHAVLKSQLVTSWHFELKEVKICAIQQGVKLTELLTTYIEIGLRAPQTLEKDTPPHKNSYPLPKGIPRIPGAPLHPALSNTDLYALLEEKAIENYHRIVSKSSKKNLLLACSLAVFS